MVIKNKDTKQETDDNKAITIADLFSAIKETKDAREVAFSNMVEKLFNKDALLMISRLDKQLRYYIVKHLIIDNFYNQFYQQIEVKVKFVKDKKFPFYKRQITEIIGNKKDIMIKGYRKLIDELLQITISDEGKGRTEILSIIAAAEQKIRELEAQTGQSLGSTVKRFY